MQSLYRTQGAIQMPMVATLWDIANTFRVGDLRRTQLPLIGLGGAGIYPDNVTVQPGTIDEFKHEALERFVLDLRGSGQLPNVGVSLKLNPQLAVGVEIKGSTTILRVEMNEGGTRQATFNAHIRHVFSGTGGGEGAISFFSKYTIGGPLGIFVSRSYTAPVRKPEKTEHNLQIGIAAGIAKDILLAGGYETLIPGGADDISVEMFAARFEASMMEEASHTVNVFDRVRINNGMLLFAAHSMPDDFPQTSLAVSAIISYMRSVFESA